MRHGQRKAFEQPDVPRPRELPLAAAIERPIPKAASFLIEGVNPVEIARQTKVGIVSAQNAAQPLVLQRYRRVHTPPR